jgi:murein DD-endopeptidase MepM/ murein hydrolase activator NlpD
MTPQEFLNNHKAQEAVARAKLWSAFKTYDTPKEAAMSWFGGAGGVANPYPAVTTYGKEIMERMRDMGYTNRDPQQAQVGPNGFVMPVKGAGITDSYGWRTNPVTGERSFHTGVDFSAGQGTPIRALADGRIVSMEYDPVYGWQTIIKSKGGNLQTMYGHMKKFNPNLDEGMRIDAGTRIGRVGSTGWSTGPHLHFEVERNGENVDPLKFLKQFGVGRFGGPGGGQQQGPIRPSSNSGRPRNPGRNAGQQTGSNLNSLLQGYNLI